jgi:hypothetical protein
MFPATDARVYQDPEQIRLRRLSHASALYGCGGATQANCGEKSGCSLRAEREPRPGDRSDPRGRAPSQRDARAAHRATETAARWRPPRAHGTAGALGGSGWRASQREPPEPGRAQADAERQPRQ